MAGKRYSIKITTSEGLVVYWVKRGRIHTLDEDLAKMWVANFKPEIFQVTRDGALTPPAPEVETFPIAQVEMELAT